MSKDNYIVRGETNLEIPEVGLGEYLLEYCLLNQNKIAVIDSETKASMTFKELNDEAMKLAIALREKGIKDGDTIGVCGDNTIYYPVVVLSACYAGVILAPYNNGYSVGELEHAISLSKPKIIFSSPRLAKSVKSAAEKLNFVKEVIVLTPDDQPQTQFTRNISQKQLSNFKPSVIRDPKNDVALIMCSSGTTGLPKGVMLTHHNILTTIAIFTQPKYEALGNTDTGLAILPPYHLYGLLCLYLYIIGGVTTVVIKNFTPEAFLQNVQDYKIPKMALVPPILAFLAKNSLPLKYDLSSIDSIVCGAAPLSADLEREIHKRYPNIQTVQQAYGMTESAATILKVPNGEVKRGSVGIVVPTGEIKVIDMETGKSLGPNKPGELCYRGPMIMKGYIGNEKATAETIDSEGWLHSGDVGYYDEDNWFYIVDRLKELIKYKGFQVPPAELEAVLLTHPAVLDAAVIGIPDEAAGELPKAFIVKKSPVTEKEIREYVEGKVSNPKRLRGGVEFVESIPKNPSGKILRRLLRNRSISASKL